MVTSSLQDAVHAAVQRYRANAQGDGSRLASAEYMESFSASSRRKGGDVLRSLKEVGAAEDRIVYVSIGSAECYEIEHVMDHSEISRFLAFDISDAACEAAWKRLKGVLPSKELTILSGDVINNVVELHSYLKELINSNDDIIVISIHGMLHELISQDIFEIEEFLKSIIVRYNRIFLYIREPCYPVNMPDLVELSYKGLGSNDLFNIARTIQNGLGFDSNIKKTPSGGILCNGDLAIETIVKIFYIEDFEYEMGEKITSVNPFQFVAMLDALSSEAVVDYSLMNSCSFFKNFAQHVELRNTDGTLIPIPLNFIKALFMKGLE